MANPNTTEKLTIGAVTPLERLVRMASEKGVGKKQREFANSLLGEICNSWSYSNVVSLQRGQYVFTLDGANISFTVKEKTEKTTAKK